MITRESGTESAVVTLSRRTLLLSSVGVCLLPYVSGAQEQRTSVTDYLGRGVDLFKTNPWNVDYKRKLIDGLSRDAVPLRNTSIQVMRSDSVLDLSHQLAVEAGVSGSYGQFSGSVSTKFGQSVKIHETAHFVRISALAVGNEYSVPGTRESFRQQLRPDVVAALAKMPPADLFNDFGTHLIVRVQAGGRADYYRRLLKSSNMTTSTFELAATASFKGLGGSAEAHTNVSTADSNFQSDSEGSSNLETIGGDPAVAMKISQGGGWATWAASCKDTPGFLGFGPAGLVPLWELAADEARRGEIYAAYRRRAATYFDPQILTAESGLATHPDGTVTVPTGYKLLTGGAREQGGSNFLTGSYPSGDNTWRANGKDLKFDAATKMTVFAIAIKDPDNVWEVKTFKAATNSMNKPSATATVSDPLFTRAGGGARIGGGVAVLYGGNGEFLIQSMPRGDDSWYGAAKDHIVREDASLVVYVTALRCVEPGVTLSAQVAQATSLQSHAPEQTVAAPAATRLVGGGAASRWQRDQGILFAASFPVDQTTWKAVGHDHLNDDDGWVDVVAIGLQVKARDFPSMS